MVSGEPLKFVSRENAPGENNDSTTINIELKVTDSDKQSTTATLKVELQPGQPMGGSGVVYLPVLMSGS